jgi:hypothetical protein
MAKTATAHSAIPRPARKTAALVDRERIVSGGVEKV